jgi:hypothetical protein
MTVNLEVALSYTPPGSDLSLTVAVVRDVALLAAVLDHAIKEADLRAATERNPVSASGFRKQREFLRGCLSELQTV